MAVGARRFTGQLDGDGGAFDGFAEVEFYLRFDIGPPRRPSTPASAAAAVKEATEEVTKTAFRRKSSALSKRFSESVVGGGEVLVVWDSQYG